VTNQSLTALELKLEKITLKLPIENILLNPFYRISKGTPEQLKQYETLHGKYSYILVSIRLLLSVLVTPLKILLYIIFSMVYRNTSANFCKAIPRSDVIFLSHALTGSLNQSPEDQFYGEQPSIIASKCKVSIIYTNHFRTKYKSNSNLLLKKIPNVQGLLIPKFLSPLENYQYLRTMLKLIYQSFCALLLSDDLNYEDKNILLLGISKTFSRATYSNYLLQVNILKVLTLSHCKSLVLTLEGHSYEDLLYKLIESKGLRIKCIYYQHSPIVLGHIGIKTFLRSIDKPLEILTTGPIYSTYLSNLAPHHNYSVVGSMKFSQSLQSKDNVLSQRILLTPEGTNLHSVEFTKLASTLSRVLPNYEVAIRFHPNLSKGLKLRFLIFKMKHQKNFSVSKLSLNEDLYESKYVVFRSSAVGVETLTRNSIPLFISDEEFEDLNVFSIFHEAPFPLAQKDSLMDLITNLTEVDSSKSEFYSLQMLVPVNKALWEAALL